MARADRDHCATSSWRRTHFQFSRASMHACHTTCVHTDVGGGSEQATSTPPQTLTCLQLLACGTVPFVAPGCIGRRAWAHRDNTESERPPHQNVHNEILARNWAVQEILARNSGILQLMMQQRTFCVIVLHMTLRFSKNFSYVKRSFAPSYASYNFTIRNITYDI